MLTNELNEDMSNKTTSLAQMVSDKAEHKRKVTDRYLRSFEAAKFNRLTSSWTTVDFSPAQELYYELQTLKVRSRNLYQNSPVVSNFIGLLQQNVVGANGFTFKSKVLDRKGNLDVKINSAITAAWNDFCKLGNCEVTGQYSLIDALDLMMQSLGVDGEILLKKVYGEGKYGMQLQLLHSEQLIVNRYEQYDMGILRNEYGKPISYALTDKHPGDGILKYVYEPADRIIHAFIPYQIGAPRGVPMTSASMMAIKMLDEYKKAEVLAARLGASSFVVITQKQHEDLELETAMDSIRPSSVSQNAIEPGSAMVVAPGEDVKFLTATHPATAFPEFTKSLKKEISAGIGLSYNTLYSDFENTSFSSMRAAFITERAFYRKLQALIIEKVLGPVFEAFLETAILSGKLKLPPVLGDYDYYKAYEFTGKAYDFANPLAEAEAQKLLVDNRLMSRTQIAAERGINYGDILRDMAEEQRLEEESGINFEVLPKASVIAALQPGVIVASSESKP